VPNQALSNQRQAIWIGRQCFLMRNKIIIHANKMNALKTVLINPQIEISTFCDQPNVTSYFSPKIKTKSFHHF
jgi:hypothetical protein